MTPDDLDEAFLHEMRQHFATTNPTNRFDVRPHDRLTIGDDRERLQGGSRQANLVADPLRSHQPRPIDRAGVQLKAPGYLFDLERRTVGVVQCRQTLQLLTSLGSIGQSCGRGYLPSR